MEAMREEEQTSEEQEVGEEDALVRSGGSFEGSWFLGTLIFKVFPLLLKKGLSLELLGLHSIIIMNKQSFLLPEIPQIPLPEGFAMEMEVTYFSDCVFKPYIYKLSESELAIVDSKLTIDFGFLTSKVITYPKILDNIGVLKIGKLIRYGVLVTKEKEGLFVSLID